jgi:hypothetical protein
MLTYFTTFIRLETALLELSRVDFDPDGELRIGNTSFDLLDDSVDDTSAILEASTVVVRTVVRGNRKELCEEKPMRRVEFYTVVSRSMCEFSSISELTRHQLWFIVAGNSPTYLIHDIIDVF